MSASAELDQPLEDDSIVFLDYVDQVDEAKARISDVVRRTPLELSPSLSEELGHTVLLKRDDLTAVNSFKLRGAANKILSLTPEELHLGVIAASAGNHAQGVAYIARHLGINATIVMPTTTPEQKIKAVKEMGAKIILSGDTYSDAYEHSQKVKEETGATYIHPFDDNEVITGQATLALEILQQSADVDHIFVPVGGGGLLAGVVKIVKELKPSVKIFGVQPESSSMMTQSLEADEILEATHVGNFADGVAVKKVGVHTFDAARLVDGMITVSDDEISLAVAKFVQEKRSVLEPAGALAIAGLRKYTRQHDVSESSVSVAICSGANVDNSRLLHALSRAEKASEHNALLRIALPEHPGALRELCRAAINGHNITQFNYRIDSSDSSAQITIGLRIRDKKDKATLLKTLEKSDYSYRDLSDNELVKEHGIQSSGNKPDLNREVFYSLEFADRPGALLDLLDGLGDKRNISLFNYGGSEGDTGRVVIGFETTERAELEDILESHTVSFKPADDDVMLMYS